MSPRIFGRASETEPEAPAEPDDAVPADLAAAARRYEQQGRRARLDADAADAETQAAMMAAEREAAAIIAAAKATAREIGAAARKAAELADALEVRAALMKQAAAEHGQAAGYDQQVKELTAEREQLAGQMASLDATIAELQAANVDRQLAAATTRADVPEIARLRGIADAQQEALAALTGQRAEAEHRWAAIGDGGEYPGELADAVRGAELARAAERRALNELFPSRPEAVWDADLAELRGAIAGNLARINEAAAAGGRVQNVIRI